MSRHLWVSTFTLGKGFDLGNIPHTTAFYTKYYTILRAQQTLLTQIKSAVTDLLGRRDGPNKEVLKNANLFCNALLEAKFGNLLDVADDIVIHLRDLMKNEKLEEDIAKILLKLMKITITITGVLASLQWREEQDGSPQQRPPPSHITTSERGEVAVCRICDKQICVEHFEEHTKSCLEAYKTSLEIRQIDTEIQTMETRMNDVFLNVGWPGTNSDGVNVYLPMIHVSLILRRALEIEIRSCDAVIELEAISTSLSSFKSLSLPSGVKDILGNMISCVGKKRAAAKKFEQAFTSLQRTTGGELVRAMDIQPMICDFELIKRISSGAFARVFLARKKSTGDIFAIKVLPKEEMIQKNQVKRLFAERDILLWFRNPGIIKFYYSIIGNNNLYLVMEYLPGGDLYSLLQNLNALSEEHVKVYTYQIVKALEFLHSHGIIHRDLKPDNILVAADGSLKLTDFGLSSVGLIDRRQPVAHDGDDDLSFSKSLVGTPDYVAPEIIMNLPHSYAADWWSLGVMVYEFLCGAPPFHEDTIMETFQHILTGEYEPLTEEEDEVSPLCMDFISKLLVDDPKKRLGANGPQEVLNHPWLATIRGPDDLVAPFTPKLSDEADTRYFEQRYVPSSEDNADIYYDIKAAVDERRRKKQENRRLSCDVDTRVTRRRRSSILGLDGDGSDSGYSADDIDKFSCIAVAELGSENEKVSRRLRSLSGLVGSEIPQMERRSFLALSRGKMKSQPRQGAQMWKGPDSGMNT